MTDTGFPYNVIDLFGEHVITLLDDAAASPTKPAFDVFLKRPMRPEDPNRSCAMFPLDWTPGDSEIQGARSKDPSLARYDTRIYVLVRGDDEAEIRRIHARLTKKVRTMIYRDPEFRSALHGLAHTDEYGITERLQRYDIGEQRYLLNEVQGTFICVSSTRFWVEVETT